MTDAREAIARAIDHCRWHGVEAGDGTVSAFLTALSEAGWVVVPKEPTEAMLNAAVDALDLGLGMSWRSRSPQMLAGEIYAVMLSATPPAKGGEDE